MGAYALIAETDPAHADLYREVAASEGLETVVARDGEQALAYCKQKGKPALVITDLTLPRVDGFALLRELRKTSSGSPPPAVVVSAFRELRGAAETLKDQLGIRAILSKTQRPEAIRTSLRDALAGRPVPVPAPEEIAAQEAAEERARLLRIKAMGIVDNLPPDEALQDLVEKTAEAFRVPVALISFILEDRQWFKAHVGLTGEAASNRGTPREWAFCRHVVQGKAPLVVPDARNHPYFSTNPLVKAGVVGSYAGAPLITPGGMVLGTLCIVDSKPMSINVDEVETLSLLARRVAGELEMKSDEWRETEKSATGDTTVIMRPGEAEATKGEPWTPADLRTALSSLDSAIVILDASRRVLFCSPAFSDLFERPIAAEPGSSREDFLKQLASFFGDAEEFLRRLRVGPEGPYTGREVFHLKTPRDKVIRWTARPIPRPGGYAQLESFTDVTA